MLTLISPNLSNARYAIHEISKKLLVIICFQGHQIFKNLNRLHNFYSRVQMKSWGEKSNRLEQCKARTSRRLTPMTFVYVQSGH
jgi:hypothetical protein